MDREDLDLYHLIKEKIEDYGLEYILEVNDLTPEDAVFHLMKNLNLELPE